MAEQEKIERTRRGGTSATLLIAGLLALAVSIWGLAGGAATIGGTVSVGWVLVIGAIVVGLLLVIAPRRKC